MKTMILENDVSKIEMYDSVGVSRIFIDLEILGKLDRQGGMDTVISNHSIQDVINARSVIKHSELLVRVNPMNKLSMKEISDVISAGADVIMLPMFKTKYEVESFVKLVGGRAKTSLLLETSEALARIDDILDVNGIDEIHIGLNDLHLALGLDFMFELMAGPLVELLSSKIREKNIVFGVGGVSRVGTGLLQADTILKEHVRLGSSRVILSRAFKDVALSRDELIAELSKIHEVIESAQCLSESDLIENHHFLKLKVHEIVNDITGV